MTTGLSSIRERFFPGNAVEINTNNGLTVSSPNGPDGQRGFIGDVMHAVDTIGYDPGNHKKKALGYTAGALGVGALTAATLARGGGLTNAINNFRNVTGASALTTALGLGSTALAYYAARNRDYRPKQLAGVLGSLGTLGTKSYVRRKAGLIDETPQPGMPPRPDWMPEPQNPAEEAVVNSRLGRGVMRFGYDLHENSAGTAARNGFNEARRGTEYENMSDAELASALRDSAVRSLGTKTTMGLGLSALDEFQQVEDNEKLKAIAADPKLTPAQRKHQMEMITQGKDFFTRYPAFRYMPGGQKLRSMYNNRYYPEPKPTDAAGNSLPTVGQGNTGFLGGIFKKTKPFYHTYDVPASLQSESALNNAFAAPKPATDFVRSKIRE